MTSLFQLCKSTSGGKLGPAHPGRPEDEEPHVKKTIKGKKEVAEYIVKVDQVRKLGTCPVADLL